jgi:hypothetical protein
VLCWTNLAPSKCSMCTFPTTDGCILILSRYTHPEPDHKILRNREIDSTAHRTVPIKESAFRTGIIQSLCLWRSGERGISIVDSQEQLAVKSRTLGNRDLQSLDSIVSAE